MMAETLHRPVNRLTRSLVWMVLLSLAACASAPREPTPDPCDPATAWQAGLDGTTTAGACDEPTGRLWREALNLGAELRTLLSEQAALDRDAPGAALTEARLQREIDQIRGAALIRGWPLPED